jgi:hypothetical protein
MVVYVYESKLHGPFFLCVLVIELHFGKEQFGIVIILDLEVSSLWHEADDLCWVISCFVCLVYCQRCPF